MATLVWLSDDLHFAREDFDCFLHLFEQVRVAMDLLVNIVNKDRKAICDWTATVVKTFSRVAVDLVADHVFNDSRGEEAFRRQHRRMRNCR